MGIGGTRGSRSGARCGGWVCAHRGEDQERKNWMDGWTSVDVDVTAGMNRIHTACRYRNTGRLNSFRFTFQSRIKFAIGFFHTIRWMERKATERWWQSDRSQRPEAERFQTGNGRLPHARPAHIRRTAVRSASKVRKVNQLGQGKRVPPIDREPTQASAQRTGNGAVRCTVAQRQST